MNLELLSRLDRLEAWRRAGKASGLRGPSARPRFASIECPGPMRPHVQQVLAGEYALPRGWRIETPRRVVDVGANVGAFAIWAREQWPRCELDCYEPHPDNAAMLRRNVEQLGEGVRVHETAVVEETDTLKSWLYDGRNNCGEASLWRGGEQLDSGRMVECIPARDLPACDILKVDTEGCELEILRGYPHLDALLCVMLEWHRYEDRWAIGALLAGSFECIRDETRRKDRGVMVWVRDDERELAP